MILESERRQALADRQSGFMPSEVRDRPDAIELWVAVRRYVGLAYEGRTLAAFVAGWDAALKHAEATWQLHPMQRQG